MCLKEQEGTPGSLLDLQNSSLHSPWECFLCVGECTPGQGIGLLRLPLWHPPCGCLVPSMMMSSVLFVIPFHHGELWTGGSSFWYGARICLPMTSLQVPALSSVPHNDTCFLHIETILQRCRESVSGSLHTAFMQAEIHQLLTGWDLQPSPYSSCPLQTLSSGSPCSYLEGLGVCGAADN